MATVTIASPIPVQPFVPPPAVEAAIAAFATRLDPGDPLLVAFNVGTVSMVVSDPTLPDNPIIYANQAFLALTGFDATEVVGRNCRFMQGPLTVREDVIRLREAIRRRERIEIDLLNHRRDGTPFWNRLMVAPVFDATGAARYFVACQLDVTLERHRLKRLQEDRETLAAKVAAQEAALAEREARLALALRAGGLGTWTLDLRSQELTASDSCKACFGQPLDDPFPVDAMLAAIHPEDQARCQAAMIAASAGGEPFEGEYRVLTPAGAQRWVQVRGELQRRADGTPLALSGFATDISDRKFAEEHRAVLARELTHRVKNTLATVGAVVLQTLRDATSVEDARQAVAGRIASLGTAHELLIEEEKDGAAVGDIVRRVLAPFLDRGNRRFTIDGPPIRLSPDLTLALSMALYELATNAVKYGALSGAEGQVAIRWALVAPGGQRRLAFSWTEAGGPPVAAPNRNGFGTRMIDRVLARHADGSLQMRYPPEGAQFSMEVPI